MRETERERQHLLTIFQTIKWPVNKELPKRIIQVKDHETLNAFLREREREREMEREQQQLIIFQTIKWPDNKELSKKIIQVKDNETLNAIILPLFDGLW